jgi:hypothetical protein
MTPGNKLTCTQELDLYKQRAVPDWTGHKFCPEKKRTLTKQTNSEMQDNASGQREKNATREKNKLLATSREGMS